MSAETLGGLIGTLVAARHAGGYRYDFPERVLRQFAGHCRREGYADGSIVREAVEEFLYGRHLKASTIRREELVLRDLAGHARQFGWQAWAPPALTAVKKPHRPPPYVFSDEETRRLFRVIDTQPLSENSNRALVDPVLFRVFYGGKGCGCPKRSAWNCAISTRPGRPSRYATGRTARAAFCP